MTLEAAAGKNPRNHVGKIYSIAAQQIAQRLAVTVPGVRNAQVYIVSQIGRPIDTDAIVNIQVVADDLDAAQTEGTCIARDVLAGLPNVWQGVMEREFSLYQAPGARRQWRQGRRGDRLWRGWGLAVPGWAGRDGGVDDQKRPALVGGVPRWSGFGRPTSPKPLQRGTPARAKPFRRLPSDPSYGTNRTPFG